MTDSYARPESYAEWLRRGTLPGGAGRAFADALAAQTPPPGPDEPDDEPDDEPARIPQVVHEPGGVAPSLVITFAGPDSATLRVDATGTISIGQIFAAAYLLDCMARESRAQQFAATTQIARPSLAEIADSARRWRLHQ